MKNDLLMVDFYTEKFCVLNAGQELFFAEQIAISVGSDIHVLLIRIFSVLFQYAK